MWILSSLGRAYLIFFHENAEPKICEDDVDNLMCENWQMRLFYNE